MMDEFRELEFGMGKWLMIWGFASQIADSDGESLQFAVSFAFFLLKQPLSRDFVIQNRMIQFCCISFPMCHAIHVRIAFWKPK
jgi:hypothetical protein